MAHDETIATYNNSAPELAAYFAGVGPRTTLIEKSLELAGQPADARVVEVGCGDGRDAAEIIPRVGWYEGFDPSEGLLSLAQERLPNARFVRADALSYGYPEELDVVYAFASFLHLNRNDFEIACARVTAALRRGGILFMTLKARDTYQQELVEDQFGKRLFYYYDEATACQLAGKSLELTFAEHEFVKTTHWLLLGFRKQ